MCEKVKQLYCRDDPFYGNKTSNAENIQQNDVNGLLEDTSSTASNIYRTVEMVAVIEREESQNSDEYLIIDEAIETPAKSPEAGNDLQEDNNDTASLLRTSSPQNTFETNGFNLDSIYENAATETASSGAKTIGVQIDPESSKCPAETSVDRSVSKSLVTSVSQSISNFAAALSPSACASSSCCSSSPNVESHRASKPNGKVAQQTLNNSSKTRCLPKIVSRSTSDLGLASDDVTEDIGVGLQNMGNTCFVNATLQCLTYTPLFTDMLIASPDICSLDKDCITCELIKHVRSCFHGDGKAIKPSSILKMLKGIAQHMRWGRQEDAHEFLRYLMDSLHKSYMTGHQRAVSVSNKSIVQEIFAGELRSQVICEECTQESDTFDPFLDLCLDVKSSTSIIEALSSFVRFETLEGENSYYCARCAKSVRAKKLFSIHKLPHVLTIQLKRYGTTEGKVTRHIDFPSQLDLRPYTSQRALPQKEEVLPGSEPHSKILPGNGSESHAAVGKGGDCKERCDVKLPCMYNLYAVLVHDGHSTNSGHYYCYVRTKLGRWYCMNDHMVKPSTVKDVLSSEAYLLFYCEDPITFGPELSQGHQDNRGAVSKMVTSSSCSNLCLKSSFSTSSKGTCRGGRLQATGPVSMPSQQFPSEPKSKLTSQKKARTFSNIHRPRASKYRYKRLRLSGESLKSVKTNKVPESPVKEVSVLHGEELKVEDSLAPPEGGAGSEIPVPPSFSSPFKNRCSTIRLRQKARERPNPRPKALPVKLLIPPILADLLKPQKIKQTSEESSNKSFKIPLKKSSVTARVDQKSDSTDTPTTITTNVKVTNEDKNDEGQDVATKSQASKSKQPSKSCDGPPVVESQTKIGIQLRPRRTQSVREHPLSSDDAAVVAQKATGQSEPPRHSSQHDQPETSEHRKVRKRKADTDVFNCRGDAPGIEKCLGAARSKQRQSRTTTPQKSCVVAPIKLKKVAVTEDGEHLYRIV